MNIPSVAVAETMLEEAAQMYSGPWVAHVRHVALAAASIAEVHPNLDAEAAYIMGLLHDIGRREGDTGIRHILDGYVYLNERGYSDAARICLTHSFPTKDIDAVFNPWDCSPKEKQFVEDFILKIEYDIYDRLIQLCDFLGLPEGCCLIEKRLVDILRRYGCNDRVISKWWVVFDIQRDFELAIGQSIYGVLPGVVETTFGFDSPA